MKQDGHQKNTFGHIEFKWQKIKDKMNLESSWGQGHISPRQGQRQELYEFLFRNYASRKRMRWNIKLFKEKPHQPRILSP